MFIKKAILNRLIQLLTTKTKRKASKLLRMLLILLLYGYFLENLAPLFEK
jgi:hypothetical protein